VFEEKGHPVRATVSDLGVLLLDIKDLRAMRQHVAERASEFLAGYGNISAASIGAIQRGLIAIDAQVGEALVAAYNSAT
jgi:hypothetical protein